MRTDPRTSFFDLRTGLTAGVRAGADADPGLPSLASDARALRDQHVHVGVTDWVLFRESPRLWPMSGVEMTSG